jgi:hypothetical protein
MDTWYEWRIRDGLSEYWAPGERRRRRRTEVKWEKDMEAVMKKKILTFDEAINRHIWRLKSNNRGTTGKLIDIVFF